MITRLGRTVKARERYDYLANNIKADLDEDEEINAYIYIAQDFVDYILTTIKQA